MAHQRDVGDLIQEEMDRVKRREREIQDEVYRERFEERHKYGEMRNKSRRSRSRDSSRSSSGSYDIAQELEEERERKRQMAKELEIRERQIQRSSELLERQSQMLANLEANVKVQSHTSMYNHLTTSVYQQSIHTDYQYPQQLSYPQLQYPQMNTVAPPAVPYYQYNQHNITNDMYYTPPPVTGIVEEPAAKKARTETSFSVLGTEINTTGADFKQNTPELKCTFNKCKQTGHVIADCNMLKKKSLHAICFYCKDLGHRIEQCPKLALKQEKLKEIVCFNCNTVGHHCKDCPAKKQEIVCFNCNTVGHHCKDCPAKKTKEIVCFNCHTVGHHCKDCPEVKQTSGMGEAVKITDTTVALRPLNNIQSNLVSIACSDAQLNNSFVPVMTISATKEKQNAAVTKSETTINSQVPIWTKSAKKRNRKREKRSENSQELACVSPSVMSGSAKSSIVANIDQNTSLIATSNPSDCSSNITAKYTSTYIKTETILPSMSNTNYMTSKEITLPSIAVQPVKNSTDLNIADELEKFKNNPKHMISMAKYRRHIVNLRKAESEKNKSTVQTQATKEKPDSNGHKVEQENIISSQSQNSNSEKSQNDNDPQKEYPVKESTKEVEKPQSVGITCDICQFTSKIQSEMNTHKQTTQHINKVELCKRGCKMCGKEKFKTFTDFTSHKSERLHRTLISKKGQITSSKLAKIANKVAGIEYVVPVSGFFCKLCKKFYSEESYAKDEHCRSKEHHEKIGEVISTKYETAIRAKVLEIYKVVKKGINLKNDPARFFKALASVDFTNLKPLASDKSIRNKPNTKEISETVTKSRNSSLNVPKELIVTEELQDTVKNVDISNASDIASKISKQPCNISSSVKRKAHDPKIKPTPSARHSALTMKSSNSDKNHDVDYFTIKQENVGGDAAIDKSLEKDPDKDHDVDYFTIKQENVGGDAAIDKPSEKDPDKDHDVDYFTIKQENVGGDAAIDKPSEKDPDKDHDVDYFTIKQENVGGDAAIDKLSKKDLDKDHDDDYFTIKQENIGGDAAIYIPSRKDSSTELLKIGSLYVSSSKQDDLDLRNTTQLKFEEVKVESVRSSKDVQTVKAAAIQNDNNNSVADDEDSSDTVVYDAIKLNQMVSEDRLPNKMDIDTINHSEIKNFTSIKSLCAHSDQSSSQLKPSGLQESERVLKSEGSPVAISVHSSSTSATSTTEKKSEKLVSTDTDADILFSDDDDTNLSGDCDSDIELSD